MQTKLQEEEVARNRDKTLLMQKENKIKVLETKLGEKSTGGASVKIHEQAPKSIMKNSQQKLVSGGKVTAKEDAEKQLIEGIRKRPILEDSPVLNSKPKIRPPIAPSPLQEKQISAETRDQIVT